MVARNFIMEIFVYAAKNSATVIPISFCPVSEVYSASERM